MHDMRRFRLAALIAFAAAAAACLPAQATERIPGAESPFRLTGPDPAQGIPDDAYRHVTGGRGVEIAAWNRPDAGYVLLAVFAATAGDRGLLKKDAQSDDLLDTFVFLNVDGSARPAFDVLAGASSAAGTLKLIAFKDSRDRQCIGFLGVYRFRQGVYQRILGGNMCPAGSNGGVERQTFVQIASGLSLKGEFDALVE